MRRLRAMSDMWGAEFWTYDEVVDSLSRRTSELFYLEEPVAETRVGGGWAGLVFVSVAQDFCDILFVFVDPGLRGRGWGSAILRGLAAECRGRAISRIGLEARASNGSARALYQKVGMTEVAVRRKYYSDGEDAVIYSWDCI